MTHFKIYQYTLPFHPPFQERTGLLLQLLHQDKRVNEGWGEIAPLPGRNRETLNQALEQLLYVLKNKPHPLPRLFSSVAFGLFSALHYQAPKHPLPLSTLLAGTPEQILSKAQIALRHGYTSAKLKISGMPLHIAKELIDTLQTQFCLRIDANRAFSFKEAMQLCESCQKHNIDYIEEPTYELDQLEHFSYPFALDESLLEITDLPPTSYFKAIVFKPSVMGAYEECLSFAHHSKNKERKIILSSACETGVGILGIASLAACLPIAIYPLGLDTYRFLTRDILSSPLDFSSNTLLLPSSIQVNTPLLREIAHG